MPTATMTKAATPQMATPARVKYIANLLGLRGNVAIKGAKESKDIGVRLEGFYDVVWRSLHTTIAYATYHLMVVGTAPKIKAFTSALLLDQVKRAVSIDDFQSAVLQLPQGHTYSVATGWYGHAVGINFIKENDQLHMIFVNRGGKFPEPFFGKPDQFLQKNLQVYTWDLRNTAEQSSAAAMLTLVYQTCTGQQQKQPGRLARLIAWLTGDDLTSLRDSFEAMFNNKLLTIKRNEKLSDAMPLPPQTAGNCAEANRQEAWHIALAGEYLQSHTKADLLQAYKSTFPTYQKMCLLAGVSAFVDLLTYKRDFVSGWETMAIDALQELMRQAEQLSQSDGGGNLIAYLKEACQDKPGAGKSCHEFCQLIKTKMQQPALREAYATKLSLQQELAQHTRSLKNRYWFNFIGQWLDEYRIARTKLALLELPVTMDFNLLDRQQGILINLTDMSKEQDGDDVPTVVQLPADFTAENLITRQNHAASPDGANGAAAAVHSVLNPQRQAAITADGRRLSEEPVPATKDQQDVPAADEKTSSRPGTTRSGTPRR